MLKYSLLAFIFSVLPLHLTYAATACPTLAGIYEGQCVVHWEAGNDYKYTSFAKITQLTSSGGPGTDRPLLAGLGCGSVSLLRWTGKTPKEFDVIEKQDFDILASTEKSDTLAVKIGDKTVSSIAYWSADHSQLLLKRITNGLVEGRSAYTSTITTALTRSGNHLVWKEAGVGSFVNPTDCLFTLLP